MLMSRYDPVTKKIVFGQQAGQAPGASAIPMPDGSTQNYTPSVVPQDPNTSGFATLPQLSVSAPVPQAASNAGGGMMRQPLGQYYSQLEQERGLPGGFLAKTRAIESSNGTNLQNPNSSAKGDFQFINSTAKQFGLTNPMDPYASAKAAADLAAQNQAGILKATGKQPDLGDLYVAHQQGLGGYLGLTRGVMPSGQAASLNGGNGQTAAGFLQSWKDKVMNAKVANLDGFTPSPEAGANQGQGPTVANAAAQGLPTGPVAQPVAPDNTYKGGLLGLFGVGDQSAPGMSKDVLGKLGDMAAQPGGGALGGLGKAVAGMMQAPQQSAPGITIAPPADGGVVKPDASLMAYLDPRKRRMIGG